MKRKIAALLAMVMSLSLAACGGGTSAQKDTSTGTSAASASESAKEESSSDAAGKDEYTVGLIIFSMAEEFGIDVIEGAQKKAEEIGGINVVVMDPAGDMQKDISIMEDMISQKVDAIAISPIDAEAIGPYIAKAREAGIPVIDWDVETQAEVDAKVLNNNFEGGALDAKYLVEKMGTEGKVLILDDLESVTTSVERISGFEEELAKLAPNVEVIKQLSTTTGTRDIHQTTTENMLQAYPDITAVFCCDGSRTLGAYVACEANNRQDVLIVGYDATPEQKEIMKKDGPDCNMIGVVDLKPKVLGSVIIDTTYRILQGEEVEPVYYSEIDYMSAEAVANGTYES